MSIRERILKDIPQYKDGNKFRDLIAFYVDGGFLIVEDEEPDDVDFDEATVVVEKEWFFKYLEEDWLPHQMIKSDPMTYLKEEYTSYDSMEWYYQALEDEKIVAVQL